MNSEEQRSMWRPLLLVAAFTAAACSSDTTASPPPAPTTTAPTPTAPTVTTTSAAPTTTVASTTTTSEDPEIAAVRAAHLAYLAMFELVGDPPNPDHPELALRATGDAYDRLRANLTQDRLAGNRLVGGYDSAIREIEVSVDAATVTDCMLDTGIVYDSTGAVIVPADTEHAVRTVRLQKVDGAWKAWRLEVPTPPIPCEP